MSYVLPDGVENLTLTGGGNINGTGNGASNFIVGNDGNNTLAGLGGADTLTGGLGADTFVFGLDATGIATVTDFVSGTDSLGVLASESAGRLVAGQAVDVVAAAEIANASHAGSAGYFIFDNSGADAGMVYWDATGGNGADATAVIKLAGVSNLLSSDFHVI